MFKFKPTNGLNLITTRTIVED
uniref:Uncharacterized protein n=1 Tax=Tetranychus urticae TaxID=32264 RepID=T1KDD7_TETUR